MWSLTISAGRTKTQTQVTLSSRREERRRSWHSLHHHDERKATQINMSQTSTDMKNFGNSKDAEIQVYKELMGHMLPLMEKCMFQLLRRASLRVTAPRRAPPRPAARAARLCRRRADGTGTCRAAHVSLRRAQAVPGAPPGRCHASDARLPKTDFGNARSRSRRDDGASCGPSWADEFC